MANVTLQRYKWKGDMELLPIYVDESRCEGRLAEQQMQICTNAVMQQTRRLHTKIVLPSDRVWKLGACGNHLNDQVQLLGP